jgi:peptidoglycan/xylan/chitin deacetylase (PgdA/CDA1 family)
MYLTKTPTFIQSLFPDYIWRLTTSERVLYLTFDDGPIPVVTEWVLDQLSYYDAKATFFCVGENVQHHANVYQRILSEGHAVGNHTYNHKNGWRTDKMQYLDNIAQCAKQVKSQLFRPPYGRLKTNQAKQIKQEYKVVMWDVLTGDFDPRIDAEKCYQNILKNTKPGSILVFHDSLKAEATLTKVLPRVLKHYCDLGYGFSSISSKIISKS